jgi:predicted HTH transcriptional regulator
LGIIEQWGNGLRLIASEMQTYPEIKLSWKEPGIAFRVVFTNKNYLQQHELQHELQRELQKETLYSKVLRLVSDRTLSTNNCRLHWDRNPYQDS